MFFHLFLATEMFNYSLETLLRDEPTWPPVTERGE